MVLAGPSFRFNYFANHFVLAPTYSQPLLSMVVVLVLVLCALSKMPWTLDLGRDKDNKRHGLHRCTYIHLLCIVVGCHFPLKPYYYYDHDDGVDKCRS